MGRELQVFKKPAFRCGMVFTNRQEIDLGRNAKMDARQVKPDVVVNCAAYTRVDQAERN